MELLSLCMPEIEDIKSAVVIIPFGSIEEHGPHLPLGTDALTAIALTQAVGQKTNALVAPPVYYGVCRSTKEHAGTISITPDALRTLTRAIIEGFVFQGFKRFVLFSGHAGSLHMAALKEVGEELVDREAVERMAICSILDLIDEGLGLETKNDSHAGELETSLMLYLHPEWVKGGAKEDYPHFPSHLLVKEKKKYWPSGIWGNPEVATREKGKQFFVYLVEKLARIVEQVKEQ